MERHPSFLTPCQREAMACRPRPEVDHYCVQCTPDGLYPPYWPDPRTHINDSGRRRRQRDPWTGVSVNGPRVVVRSGGQMQPMTCAWCCDRGGAIRRAWKYGRPWPFRWMSFAPTLDGIQYRSLHHKGQDPDLVSLCWRHEARALHMYGRLNRDAAEKAMDARCRKVKARANVRVGGMMQPMSCAWCCDRGVRQKRAWQYGMPWPFEWFPFRHTAAGRRFRSSGNDGQDPDLVSLCRLHANRAKRQFGHLQRTDVERIMTKHCSSISYM